MSEVTQVVSLARAPAGRALALVRAYGTTFLVALVVFLVGYDNGGFGESTRDMFAIALWWVVILGIGLGIWPLVRVPVAALLTGGLLAIFGLFTLLSTVWATDAGGAYAEFTRVALYVAVFGVAVVAAQRENAGRWIDGLALGLVAITAVALISRLFPHTFSNRGIFRLLPSDATRLGFPVGYYNGLAILVALAIPLLLRQALIGRNLLVRGAALVPIPAIAATIDLSSSRGGAVTAVVGVAAFILLTARRWAALAAVVVAGAGSVAAVLALVDRNTLVNGPLGSAVAESQGHSAALIIAGVCVLTGVLFGLLCKAFPQVRPSPVFGWALVFAAAVAIVAGIVAAHPVRRFEDFKRSPEHTARSGLEQHLLSGAGNGRWQLWGAAIHEFESRPLLGRGAGSYGQWWAQHRPISLEAQDAHSLYFETLGELGIVGFALLAGALLTGLVGAARRLLAVQNDDRVGLSAVAATYVAYLVSASFDWVWELPIVSVVAFVCLGLAVGPAALPATRPRLARSDDERPAALRMSRFGLGAAVIVTGWLLICAIAIPLFTGAKLRDSRTAAGSGDIGAALRAAADARDIQPWSSSPYLQLALVDEQALNFGSARRWIRKAIDRDRNDYILWVVAARIQTEQGAIRAAVASLVRAQKLNPRSDVFAH